MDMEVDASTKKDEVKMEEDVYKKYKTMQKQLEFLDIQEEYIKDEMRISFQLKNLSLMDQDMEQS